MTSVRTKYKTSIDAKCAAVAAEGITLTLRNAALHLRDIKANNAAKAVHVAVKRADGASRHAWRMYTALLREGK